MQEASIPLSAFIIHVVVPVVDFLTNDVKDLVQKFVENITKTINQIHSLSIELKNALIDFAAAIVDNVSTCFKMTFNSGFRYALAHPIIKVDTYKLRNYAERLESVNRRINNIDHRLDSLYNKVALEDIWKLLKADLFTTESKKIKKCVSYLEDTAEIFDTAERNIINNLR